MRKTLFILLSSILTLSAFAQAQKDAFVGFYKGKITLADGSELKRGYPVSMYPEIYAEVYRGPQAKYRVKILTGILSRAETTSFADGLTDDDGKIEFKTSEPLALKGTATPSEIVASGKYNGQDVKIDLKRFEFKSPTRGLVLCLS